jgi:hypothetical protein
LPNVQTEIENNPELAHGMLMAERGQDAIGSAPVSAAASGGDARYRSNENGSAKA